MNEHEFERAFKAWSQAEAADPASSALHERVSAVPLQTPQRRGLLPQSPKWRFQSMFSATKFVVAGAIVALFGGFLLAGVLTQPSEETAPPAGASATPATQSDPSPQAGLDLEEVSPGVYLVQGDGANELTKIRDVHVTSEGEVWVVRREPVGERARSVPENTVFRLTDPEPALQHRDFGQAGGRAAQPMVRWWCVTSRTRSSSEPTSRPSSSSSTASSRRTSPCRRRSPAGCRRTASTATVRWVPQRAPRLLLRVLARSDRPERPTSDGEHCWNIDYLSPVYAWELKGVERVVAAAARPAR